MGNNNDGIATCTLPCAQAGKALLPQTWQTALKPAVPVTFADAEAQARGFDYTRSSFRIRIAP